ncbi:MAG TPA: IclR family transcriptional regulator [Pseudolabrys sp.]|nr:IclR family transcriptional regulator [Pseudolabrys sp.]
MSKTLAKAIGLIELLARTPPPHRISELGRALRLNKTTVHRLLNGLVKLGYVQQDKQSAAYELTLKIWELGTHVIARRDVGRVAAGILRELAEETGETVHLAILDGEEVVYIDKADGAHPLRIFTPIGGRVPLYCGSTGKTILAFASKPLVEAVSRNLKAFTRRTITSKARLLRELEFVRQHGYAVNIGEWRDDISGVAAPIRDRNGGVIASVGVSGPSNRLPISALRSISRSVRAAADRISRELGFFGPNVNVVEIAEAQARTRGDGRRAKSRQLPNDVAAARTNAARRRPAQTLPR